MIKTNKGNIRHKKLTLVVEQLEVPYYQDNKKNAIYVFRLPPITTNQKLDFLRSCGRNCIFRIPGCKCVSFIIKQLLS